jgi:hypothetical protein
MSSLMYALWQNQQSSVSHITFHKKPWLQININGANLPFTAIYRHSLCTTFTELLFLRTEINALNALAKMQNVCKNWHISHKALFTIWLSSWKQKRSTTLSKIIQNLQLLLKTYFNLLNTAIKKISHIGLHVRNIYSLVSTSAQSV